jgi:hypothetical protein
LFILQYVFVKPPSDRNKARQCGTAKLQFYTIKNCLRAEGLSLPETGHNILVPYINKTLHAIGIAGLVIYHTPKLIF